MKLPDPFKVIIERGLRIVAITLLSACSVIHPQSISKTLGPTEREKFQRDYAACLQSSESQRPKISSHDIWGPLSAALLLAVIGAIVEYKQRLPGEKIPDDHNQHGGKAIVAFSITGMAVASGLIVAGLISRQRVEDESMRSCLTQRGYTVPEED